MNTRQAATSGPERPPPSSHAGAWPTPLEQQGYRGISPSVAMADYLRTLARAGRGAEVVSLGESARGQPLLALRIRPRAAATGALRVLLVGTQHGGSEPAGGEALLVIARELLGGNLAGVRDALDVMIIPNANPDGRDRDSSKNANDVNLNRDFVLLSQPESRALNAALLRFAPQVVLDAHESAVLKRKTLARHGYLTDFEAQFDFANNPAIPAALPAYCEDVLLPALLAGVAARGLPAQRYIREILSPSQPLTHGGLTARKFRNKAGLTGALSFLLETRLDPKAGEYPTYRNIGVRVEKQLLCLRHFLAVVHQHAGAIGALIESAADSLEAVTLRAEYVPRPDAPRLRLPLRDIASGGLHHLEFSDHRALRPGPAIARPTTYWITAHATRMAPLLARHGVPHAALRAPARRRVVVQRYRGEAHAGTRRLHEETRAERVLPAGTLAVPVRAPHGRLLPLLLDPRSTSSLFRYPDYAALIPGDGDFFILRGE